MPFTAVEKKLRALPERYWILVANYIDSINKQIAKENEEKTFSAMFLKADSADSFSTHEKFNREEIYDRGL